MRRSTLRLLLVLLTFFAAVPARAGIETTLRAEIRKSPPPAADDAAPAAERSEGPSPRRAFFFSLLVPGLGQTYASGWSPTSWHTGRGVAYAAFEALAWVHQQDDLGRGLDKQTEYRAYARANWHWAERCAEWNGGDGAIDDDPFIQGDFGGDGVDWYIDTEPEYLEFYEDIHKLQKWICGWDDYVTAGYYETTSDSLSNLWSTPMQKEYRAMRQEQNELMAAADHWVWAIVGNHLVSAFDAYFTAKSRAGGGDALSGLPRVRFDETMTRDGATVALAWQF